MSIGFWEPARQVDVTRKPFCLVSLGGVSLNPGLPAPESAQWARTIGPATGAFYQAHWYANPMLYWLEVLLDFGCLETGGFDLAYLTEVDPLWKDDELTTILNPDAILFANPIALAACAVDCVAATVGFGIPELFWCAGCQGGIYPLDGYIAAHIGGVQTSMLITQRLAEDAPAAGHVRPHGRRCAARCSTVADKRAYKTQMTYPIPNTAKLDGKLPALRPHHDPLGRREGISGSGEILAILLFRKRNCCAF